MKTLKLFLLPALESFEFAWQIIRYALIFVSAFFRHLSKTKTAFPAGLTGRPVS